MEIIKATGSLSQADLEREAAKAPIVRAAQVCEFHNSHLLFCLAIGEEDNWQDALHKLSLLLMRGVLHLAPPNWRHRAWRRIRAWLGHQPTPQESAVYMQRLFDRAGCPACKYPMLYQRAMLVIGKGRKHAEAVALGQLFDPEFGIPADQMVSMGEVYETIMPVQSPGTVH